MYKLSQFFSVNWGLPSFSKFLVTSIIKCIQVKLTEDIIVFNQVMPGYLIFNTYWMEIEWNFLENNYLGLT